MFRTITAQVAIIKEPRSKVVAYASVTIEEDLVINNFKVINGKNGLFVSNPSYRTAQEDFKDIVFAISEHTRDAINQSILDEYEIKSSVI